MQSGWGIARGCGFYLSISFSRIHLVSLACSRFVHESLSFRRVSVTSSFSREYRRCKVGRAYPDATPPDLGAPVSPSAALMAATEKGRRIEGAARVSLTTCVRNMLSWMVGGGGWELKRDGALGSSVGGGAVMQMQFDVNSS